MSVGCLRDNGAAFACDCAGSKPTWDRSRESEFDDIVASGMRLKKIFRRCDGQYTSHHIVLNPTNVDDNGRECTVGTIVADGKLRLLRVDA